MSKQYGLTWRLWVRVVASLFIISSTYTFGMECSVSKKVSTRNYKDEERLVGRRADFLRRAHRNAANEEMREIVAVLDDPSYAVWEEDRFRVLVGEPGTGKTTQALAVPVVANWHYKYRLPADYQTKDRNEAADRLLEELRDIMERGKKTVFIIDEFNGLIEYPEDKSNDNGATAKALWPLLDQIPSNENFFFLGIANDLTKIAQQMKDRAIPNIVMFEKIFNPEEKKKAFLELLLRKNVELSEECNEEFWKGLLWNPMGASRREFRGIATIALKLARRDDKKSKKVVVRPHHIRMARDLNIDRRKYTDYSRKEESDYAQRERHHDIAIKQNYELFGLGQVAQIVMSQHQYISSSFTPFGIGGSMPPSISANGVNEIRRVLPSHVVQHFPNEFH